MTCKTYLVGGAVRDELLDRPVNDFDYVVVGSTFEELQASYGDPVGLDFPVFMDPVDGSQYAMARRERKTGVGYNGFECEFGQDVTLEEDLSRRDLTINALAKDIHTGEIIDCFGGLEDLQNKILRHTSPAFSEDPLRVVRLARFAARYHEFTIAEETMVLAKEVVDSGEMDAIPNERYWAELEKAFEDNNIAQFFSFIFAVGADYKVKFFRDIWHGPSPLECASLEYIGRISKVMHLVGVSKRAIFFTALTAKVDLDEIKAVPVLVKAIHENISRIDKMTDLNVEEIFKLLQTTKAWGQGTLIDDVISCLELLNVASHITAIYPAELREVVHVTRQVTAEKYQHLKGKAIGDAMVQERKEVIAKLIERF